MLKNKTVLEVKCNDRFYRFDVDPEAPLGEVFDALTQMRGYVIDRMVENNKVEEEKKEPEKKDKEKKKE